MIYNWQQKDWLEFPYDSAAIMEKLLAFSEKSGRVSGLVQGLPEHSRNETIIDILVSEAIKTSEIEGEFLSRGDVMSSIRNNLNLTDTPMKVGDKRAEGVAEMVIAARRDYQTPLTKTMLFEWHRMLLRAAYRVKIGAWRTHSEPMQVVSGAIGKQIVHYEAPPSSAIPDLMGGYVEWFNDTAPQGRAPMKHVPVRAGIAHLYFETIHPFEDGNGRIGRTLSEKALSQGLGRPILLSLSKAIESEKKAYYDALKAAQRTNDCTEWLLYFLDVCWRAQTDAENQIEFTLLKVQFFDTYNSRLNERQIKVIQRMLAEGRQGFKGGMSAKKYVTIASTSKPTATRDLQSLVEIGVFTVTGGGRSTRYWLDLAAR
jgi:Fic family protein